MFSLTGTRSANDLLPRQFFPMSLTRTLSGATSLCTEYETFVPINLSKIKLDTSSLQVRDRRENGMLLVTDEFGYKRACWLDNRSRLSDFPNARRSLLVPRRSLLHPDSIDVCIYF